MSDQERGLYGKWIAARADGSSKRRGKHEFCRTFTLDLTHDPHAIPALKAYSRSCRAGYPKLADDLDELIRQVQEQPCKS